MAWTRNINLESWQTKFLIVNCLVMLSVGCTRLFESSRSYRPTVFHQGFNISTSHIEVSLAGDDVQIELEAAGEAVLLLGPGPEPGHGGGDHLQRGHVHSAHLADAEVGAEAPVMLKLLH